MDSRTSAGSSAPAVPPGGADDGGLPESLGYRVKKRLLGKPLVTEELQHEKLSNPVALGVLASDCISSSAYGSEAMLVQMVGVIGMSAFSLLMPITGIVLCVLTLLTLSYRQVVMVYTRAGGSYVVARENFGPRVAQIAAVALLIDYIVTVAVQTAAGTVALLSLVHLLGGAKYNWVDHYQLAISVVIVLLLCWGNLRGIREAGKAFAAPAYLFIAAMGLLFVVAIVRLIIGDLPHADVHAAGAIKLGIHGTSNQLLMGASIGLVLKAFANGGTSLTGLEAISNGVSAFRNPQGINARKTLVAMSLTLGTLVLGVSTLAYITHAIPFTDGSPSVLSQEGSLVFGSTWFGQAGLVFLQLSTALILYTGANTSFNGFPFLASFVAEDSFLPRQLTRRGHRLAFSSGILTLTGVSLVLLVVTDADLDHLLGLYAIGVFTGFFMAGTGLVKHFIDRPDEPKRALKIAINAAAAALSAVVVGIFAVTKFTEGAWVVVVVFPIGVWALIKVNRRYRDEASALAAATSDTTQAQYRRQVMYILVDRVDLAALKAISYARSLRPAEIRAVHFMIDSLEAEKLAAQWIDAGVGDLPLEIVQCPDRRITRALLELITRNTADKKSQITLLIPERNYSPVLGRLLHRRTADHIARAVGKLPNVVATIVPFDVVIKEQPPVAEAPVPAGAR
ncbi:APC family permease [Streptacidiphilus sp. PB12-B1b]|uniref:APC family permease n=1 Tax=Streptacidiphilus sp. PB12-B1b TaxID=2705012 RepID=UPI0015FD2292|nr:APC family permease [Streptacidiphilus sp. PB12-B1b]QMU75017.1 APC family permease [Streptacidiphilus sp. PB12-B1b]